MKTTFCIPADRGYLVGTLADPQKLKNDPAFPADAVQLTAAEYEQVKDSPDAIRKLVLQPQAKDCTPGQPIRDLFEQVDATRQAVEAWVKAGRPDLMTDAKRTSRGLKLPRRRPAALKEMERALKPINRQLARPETHLDILEQNAPGRQRVNEKLAELACALTQLDGAWVQDRYGKSFFEYGFRPTGPATRLVETSRQLEVLMEHTQLSQGLTVESAETDRDRGQVMFRRQQFVHKLKVRRAE